MEEMGQSIVLMRTIHFSYNFIDENNTFQYIIASIGIIGKKKFFDGFELVGANSN